MLLSRRWLFSIADDYNVRVGLADNKPVRAAAQSAIRLLNSAPWHFRLLVGGVEIAASLWYAGYWLLHAGRAEPMRAMLGFEKMPGMGTPLLRLYRGLVALSWFEQPEVLAAFGIAETAEDRQQRFRDIRRDAA